MATRQFGIWRVASILECVPAGSRLGENGASSVKRMRCALGIVASAVLATSSCSQETSRATSREYPYSPGFVDSRPQILHIFRFTGGEDERALPVNLSPVTYAPDGKSLYGFQSRVRSGLLRFDLDKAQLSVVPGSADLPGAAGVAASLDGQRIILSGNYSIDGLTTCGLFELRPLRALRLLVHNSDCGPQNSLSMWTDPSLSVDGERVVAHGRTGLKIIDLNKGTVSSFPDNYSAGAWSPDGKWLAAVETGGQRRTILMDAKTLKVERTFENSTARWSPDSRYLLVLTPDACEPYWFTFQVIDVANGQHLVVSGSRCKVNLNTLGWICPKGCRIDSRPYARPFD